MERFSSNYNYIYDSYIWLNLNPKLSKKYVDYINNVVCVLKEKNNIRLITLFENLSKNKNKNKKKIIKKNKKVSEKKLIKCQNILKEYLIIEDIEEIKYFLEEESNINKFFEDAIIQELFINEDDDFDKLFCLLKKKELFNIKNIKTKINNLNNDDIFIDFSKRKSKISAI